MTCFLAGMLTVTGVSAGQVDDVPPQTNGRGRSGYMGYRVEHGDTAYYDSIDPAWIFPKGYRGTKRDLKRYYRLVYNFNKVYPYALLAKDMESQADRHIAQNSLRRRKGKICQPPPERAPGSLRETAQEHDHLTGQTAHQTG